MRKILLSVLCAGLLSVNGAFALKYEAPNGGNLNFYPLMQQQLEHQETLDFTNNPESYKQKREAKDGQGNAVKGSNFNPYYTPNYGTLPKSRPVNMRFVKDADGNIKIQGVNSSPYVNTIKSTVNPPVEQVEE